MHNPFEVIDRRLSHIEELLLDIKHRPQVTAPPVRTEHVDLAGLMREYYPGVPESTVRQDTAKLSRTKVGKRVLFNRLEVEAHLRTKRRPSADEIDQQVDNQFTQQQGRSGGRKAA
jgi:hypothetical protein